MTNFINRKYSQNKENQSLTYTNTRNSPLLNFMIFDKNQKTYNVERKDEEIFVLEVNKALDAFQFEPELLGESLLSAKRRHKQLGALVFELKLIPITN